MQEKIKIIFSSIITDDNCQYWKNLQDMTLSSPNYPKWYNADGVGCEWLISAPEGFIIALEFNHFHVRYLLDFVKKFATFFSFISYGMMTFYHYMMELVIKQKN